MSRIEEMRYALERQRRQQMFEQRVRETTSRYLDRYRSILNDMEAQDIASFVPHEFTELTSAVDQAFRMLSGDPAGARDLSISLGSRVNALPRVARAAMRAAHEARVEADRQQRAALEKASDELEHIWQQELAEWGDALARQLSFKALAELRSSLMGPGNRTIPEQLRAALHRLKQEHDFQARELRARESKIAEKEAAAETLRTAREQVEQAKATAPETALSLERALSESAHLSSEALTKRLVEVTRQLDAAVVDETYRREVVQAVYNSLEETGFVMQRPRRLRGEGVDEVVIRAQRPAGAEAEFKVDLKGTMKYKFDRYQGSACKRDIDAVLPHLQEVYGIRLSDRRVIWENPDDHDQDARPRPTMNQERKNGL